MKTKLILFEGIPGSGKSTLAHKSSLFLNKQNVINRLYNEGDLHPANLNGYAIIKADELDDLIAKFPKEKDKIISKITPTGNHILICLKKSLSYKNAAYKYLQSYSTWGGKQEYDLFKQIHHSNWAKYTEERYNIKNETDIFECAFMQDYITDMMLFYEKSDTTIKDFMKGLEEKIIPLTPFLFYLQQNDVNETIEYITKRRTNETGEVSWDKRVSKLIETSPYGKTYNLYGYDGMVEFFKRKKEMDLSVIESLEIKRIFINNDNYDWKTVQSDVFKTLTNLNNE